MAVPTCVWLAKQRLLGRSLQSTCSSCIELLIDRSSMLNVLQLPPGGKTCKKIRPRRTSMAPRGNFPEKRGIYYRYHSIDAVPAACRSGNRVHAHPQLCHADDSRSCQTASSKPHGKQRESLRILRACSQTSASGPHARDARPLRARRARRADRAALRALRGRSRDLAGRGGRGAGCDERQCGGHTHCAALAA